MKLKKIKFLRMLGIIGSFSMITIPAVAVVSCSSSSKTNSGISNGGNDNDSSSGDSSGGSSSGDSSPGGDSSGDTSGGGSSSGGNTGDSSGGGSSSGGSSPGGGSTGGGTTDQPNQGSDDTTQSKPTPITLELANNYSLIGSSTNLTSLNYMDYVNEELNSLNAKKQLIKNYSLLTNDQLNNVQVKFIPKNYSYGSWGKTNYKTWSTKLVNTSSIITRNGDTQNQYPIYLPYNSTGQKISLSNTTNLYTYLTSDNNKNLKTIFTSSYNEYLKNNTGTNSKLTSSSQPTTYDVSLVKDSNFGIENNLLHFNVQLTSNGKNIYFDLSIPQSDISYNASNSTLAISGPNIVPIISEDFNLQYNVGLNSNFNSYTNGNLALATSSDKTLTNILSALKWGQNTSSLNQNNLSKTFGVYNVDFSNPSLSFVNLGTEKTLPTTPTTGNICNIEFSVKPKQGFYWSDGSTNSKQIKTKNITLTIETAAASNAVVVESYNLLTKLSSNDSKGLDEYFSNATNFNDFINKTIYSKSNIINTDTVNFQNVDVKFLTASYISNPMGGATAIVNILAQPKQYFSFDGKNGTTLGSVSPITCEIEVEWLE